MRIATRMFLRILRHALSDLDEEKIELWKRSLPVGELLSDRFSRAEKLGFGVGSSIYDSSIVLGEVSVGCRTWIGPFTVLDGTGGLEIGNSCSISAGVHIYTHETVEVANSGFSDRRTTARVRIGNNCYIGPQSVIAQGVSIGDGATVGACSFVNKNVPAGAKVFGAPARLQTDSLGR